MLNKIQSISQSTQRNQLAVILLLYFIFAAVFGFAFRYAMNPDGISILRLAGYVAEGNFQQSVTRAWSPLFIWLIAPFLYAGVDGLFAARLTIALCGAGLLLSGWFLSLRFDLSKDLRFIALVMASLLVSFWSIQNIGADLLVAAILLYYVYLVTDPHIFNTKRTAFYAGIVGGFSYLTHHYAMPFFLIHFPMVLFLRGYTDRDKRGIQWRKILMSWVAGTAGFLLIVSVWVGTVSMKYGQLTISSKGPIAHAAVGPKSKGHPFFSGGLYKPRYEYAIHVTEDPSEVKFKTWSPFESKEYFVYQLKLIKENAASILNHFVSKSPFFTYAFVIGTLTIIPIAFLLNVLNDKKRFLYAWVIITFSVYCSGFLVIMARSPRRFYALMLLFLFLSLHFLEELSNALSFIVSGRRKKILSSYLLIIIVMAFSYKPAVHFFQSAGSIITVDQINPYKEIAGQIGRVEFPAPYAIIRSSQKLTTDYYITYFLNKQLLGRPLSADVDGITEELKAAGGKSLLVFDNPEIVKKLKLDERYVHIGTEKLGYDKRYEYAANISYSEYEIITGWDSEVNIFTLH